MRFGKRNVVKEEFCGAKKPVKICDVDVNNIFISEWIETKNSSKYLIVYLDGVIRYLLLILPNISGYVKTFKDKDGDKDKNKNNKLMSFFIDDDKINKIRPFELRLKTFKILTWMFCQFLMIDT